MYKETFVLENKEKGIDLKGWLGRDWKEVGSYKIYFESKIQFNMWLWLVWEVKERKDRKIISVIWTTKGTEVPLLIKEGNSSGYRRGNSIWGMKNLKYSSAPIPLRVIHFSVLCVCIHVCFFHLTINTLRAKTISDSSHPAIPYRHVLGTELGIRQVQGRPTPGAKYVNMVLWVQVGKICTPCPPLKDLLLFPGSYNIL